MLVIRLHLATFCKKFGVVRISGINFRMLSWYLSHICGGCQKEGWWRHGGIVPVAGILAWKDTGSLKGQAGETRMGCLCQ